MCFFFKKGILKGQFLQCERAMTSVDVTKEPFHMRRGQHPCPSEAKLNDLQFSFQVVAYGPPSVGLTTLGLVEPAKVLLPLGNLL